MSTTTAPTINSDVKNFDLADLGKKRIEWANQSMKVLQIIRKEFIKNQPLKGIRVSACLHVTAGTASLMIALPATAAPMSPSARRILCRLRDDASRQLVRDYRIPPFAIRARTTIRTTRTSWPQSTIVRRSPWTTAPTWSECCTPSARPN
jgi:adenosylhomocysteinase